MSIPDELNTDLIHLAIVEVVTLLCGLIKDKNNLDSKLLSLNLRGSVRTIYSLSVLTGQIEISSEYEKITSTDFPGLEVFRRSVIVNVTVFCVSLLPRKSNAHKVCSLDAQDSAHNITVLSDSCFKLKSFKGLNVLR